MPKVVIQYSTSFGEYYVFPVPQTREIDEEYETIVDMKASHYKNIKRNENRWVKDQEFLEKFFIEGQTAGKEIRER